MVWQTPSVGKLEKEEDPGEGLEVIPLETLVPEPLSITIVHSEGRTTEPTPRSSSPRSRPTQKRTCALIESSDLARMQTPSVGTSRGDKLLRYLNQVVFGHGRFKFWWKDRSDRHNGVFGRSSCLMRMWRIGRPRRMKEVPVRIKEKTPDRLI
ncbi:hypothetical protein L1987_06235 [Smallanthus sonchifolius]|uniref:Uncharacterized protein n=1 Tax=Smallanthus sonchifolius TaxID=185202 RepID=A0ACB9JXY6_9ASTR|nr:hypothetical protein L1987_06235 [Smallanthus sonchifolius]